jgi:hypothetical protein
VWRRQNAQKVDWPDARKELEAHWTSPKRLWKTLKKFQQVANLKGRLKRFRILAAEEIHLHPLGG